MIKKKILVSVVYHSGPTDTLTTLIDTFDGNDDISILIIDNSVNGLKIDVAQCGYIRTENRGYGAAQNKLINIAAGFDYVCVSNPDVATTREQTKKMLDILEGDSRIGIVGYAFSKSSAGQYCNVRLQKNRFLLVLLESLLLKLFPASLKNRIYKQLLNDSTFTNRINLSEVAAVAGSLFMIPTKLFEALSGFDERFFMYYEDFDLCFRTRKFGLRIAAINDSHISHEGAFESHRNPKLLVEHLKSMVTFLIN
jgi:N-acetylglucosaminyl-diphospho-decaprenol L-rhamnosyltransferase